MDSLGGRKSQPSPPFFGGFAVNIFDLLAGTVTPAPALAPNREFHTAVQFANGRIMLIGGYINGDGGGDMRSTAFVSGKYYQVEKADGANPGLWVVVAHNVAGNGGLVEVSDPIEPGAASATYRVLLLR